MMQMAINIRFFLFFDNVQKYMLYEKVRAEISIIIIISDFVSYNPKILILCIILCYISIINIFEVDDETIYFEK